MEKRIETAINLIMFLSLLATAWISRWCTIFLVTLLRRLLWRRSTAPDVYC